MYKLFRFLKATHYVYDLGNDITVYKPERPNNVRPFRCLYSHETREAHGAYPFGHDQMD